MRSRAPASAPGLGRRWLLSLLLMLLLRAQVLRCIQLTFEVPHRASQCFHEELEQGLKFTMQYQVISGGHYDIDCYVEDPHGKPIFKETKRQAGNLFQKAEIKGVYKVCFSNEFSALSHKIVFFELLIEYEPPILSETGTRITELTQMESAFVTIHKALKTVIDSQTHYRLREAHDRNRADDLNERVSYWSLGEAVILLVVGISQVVLLKSFFTEKRPTSQGVSL